MRPPESETRGSYCGACRSATRKLSKQKPGFRRCITMDVQETNQLLADALHTPQVAPLWSTSPIATYESRRTIAVLRKPSQKAKLSPGGGCAAGRCAIWKERAEARTPSPHRLPSSTRLPQHTFLNTYCGVRPLLAEETSHAYEIKCIRDGRGREAFLPHDEEGWRKEG
jgi:hypothetical protein